jgi:hypothetical protein
MTKISPSRDDAFKKAMATFLDIDKLFGSDNPDYPSLAKMMGGYQGFAERVAGEAFVRIDACICTLIENAPEGADVAITRATLSNIRHSEQPDGTTKHVATVLDQAGNSAFRLEFNPRAGHGDHISVVNDISIRECPTDDPEYECSQRIASAHAIRPNGGDGAHGIGHVKYSMFAKFVSAMDIVKPFVSANLDKVDYGKPLGSGPLTFSQLNTISYLPAFEFDGGLPGELCLEVSDTMALSGAARAFRFMAMRIDDTITALSSKGADFGVNYLSFNDMDYLACTVSGPDGKPTAVLMTQISRGFDHNSFLAWNTTTTSGTSATTHLVALKPGRQTLDAVDSFMAGEMPTAPTASYDHASSVVNMPREFMETSVLTTAPFDVGYTLDTLKKNHGEIRQFKEMLENHTDIYETPISKNTEPLL